jgi:hypothetical protein
VVHTVVHIVVAKVVLVERIVVVVVVAVVVVVDRHLVVIVVDYQDTLQVGKEYHQIDQRTKS